MHQYCLTLINGGAPLSVIPRLKPYAITAFKFCFQLQLAPLHLGSYGKNHNVSTMIELSQLVLQPAYQVGRVH
jgi:hypothetical protein